MLNLPILVIAIETIILFGLLVSLVRLTSSYSRLKDKENKLKSADYAKRRAERILESAQTKYQEVIDDSYTKAEKTIREAKVFNDQTKEEVLVELRQTIKSISGEIKNEALEEVKEYGSQLHETVVAGEEAAQKLIAEEHDKVKAEIEEYKKAKLAEIDQNIPKIIKEVSQKVLGEAIDTEKHTQLIIEALEDAKHQNII